MANNKEISYKINFDVNKQGLNEIKSYFKDIQSMTSGDFKKLNPNLNTKQAISQLAEIKAEAEKVENALENAFNPSINSINITKFKQELKALDLNKLYVNFSAAGDVGQRAFRKVATSLASANAEMKTSNQLLDKMAQTFGNTVKWGISSSVWNNMVSNLSKAWSYTKKLDTSLNNIRIVSNESAENMANFARQANKAAQSLGTVTTQYTDAALIYYQQGLTGNDVIERTNATIKLANTTGESASQVSDYMTAIWNNFDNGSKNIEYYADVLAKLGAETASSSDEIAAGLEKFSSVANTVGLSYEYATAALTTITATTRQSADTVGTALKTLFSRIQDLELGDTLDDGTTLGTYSEALDKVGINIKNQNGELKSMDKILEEMGSKWKTLSNDQQIALAQAVAGVRQYNQLMSLMNNWDFMEENIKRANSATGTLNEQQKIYTESIAAHLKTLESSGDRLKSAFLQGFDTTGIIDGLTNTVKIFSNLIESVGGGKNAFLMLGSIGTQVFGTQIASGVAQVISNLQISKKEAENFKNKLAEFKNLNSSQITNPGTKMVVDLEKRILDLSDYMSTSAKNHFNEMLRDAEEYYDAIEKQEQDYWKLVNEGAKYNKKKFVESIEDNTGTKIDSKQNDFSNETLLAENATEAWLAVGSAIDSASQQTQGFFKNLDILKENTESALSDIDAMWAESGNNKRNKEFLQGVETVSTEYKAILSDMAIKTQEYLEIVGDSLDKKGVNAIQDFIEVLQKYQKQTSNGWVSFERGTPEAKDEIIKSFKNVEKALITYNDKIQNSKKKTDDFFKTFEKSGKNLTTTQKELKESAEQLGKSIGEGLAPYERAVDTKLFINFISAIGQVTSGLTTLANIKNIWTNDDLSTWEKVTQIISALGIGISITVSAINTLKNSYAGAWDVVKQFIIQLATSLTAHNAEKAAIDQETASLKKNTAAELENIAAKKAASKAAGSKATTELATAETSTVAAEGATTLAAAEGTAAAGGTAAAEGTMSLGTALATIIPYVLIAAAVIAALVAVVYVLVKAYNKDKDAAEEANKAVETLNETYNNCKQAAEDLKNSISDYSDAVDAMKDLTVGTKEYEEALKNANEKAKSLIETYGLFNDYEVKDGLITFKEGALENLQNKKNQIANDAESQLYGAKIFANQANLKYDNTKLQRKIGSVVGTGTYDEYGYEYTRQFSSDELSSTANALNSILDELGVDITNSDEKLKEELLKRDDIPEAIKNNIDAVLKSKESLIDFSNATKEAAEANKYYAEQIMGNVIENKYGEKIDKMATEKDSNGKDVVNENRTSQINAIATKWAAGDTSKMNKELESIDVSDASSNNKLNKNYGYDIKNDEDLAKVYAQKVLKSDLSKSEMTYKGGWNKGTIKDKSGKAIVDNVSDDVMRHELAKVAAQEKIKDKYSDALDQTNLLDNLDKAMSGMKDLGAKYGTDFTDAFLNAAVSDSHQMDLSSLYAYLDPSEIEELAAMDGQAWLDKMGLTESQLKDMGFSSANDFAESFKEGLTDYEWDAGKAVSAAISAQDKTAIEGYGLDVEELKSYSEYLMETAESADDLADSLKYDAEASTIVSQSIMRMNKGVEKLSDGFEDWSDILKKSDKSSQEYYNALTKMQDAVADLLDTEDKYVTDSFIQEHLGDIEKAANGDADAIDKLHKELAKEMVLNIATNNNGQIIDGKQIEIDIDNLRDKIANLDIPNIDVGTSLDFTEMDSDMQDFTTKMMEIVNEAHMTAEEASAFFGQMGFDAQFETHKEKITNSVPVQTTESEITSLVPLKMTSRTYQSGTESVTQEIDVPSLSTNGEAPKVKLTKKATGSYNNGSKNNSGGNNKKSGGSSKSKNKSDDKLDRYQEVNSRLGKISATLSLLQSQEEKLIGKNLVSNLTGQLEKLNAQIDVTKQKLAIAQDEQNEVANNLKNYGIKFNADGSINQKSYASIFNAEQSKYNNSYTDDEAAKKRWENFKEYITKYNELYSSTIPSLVADIQSAIDAQTEIRIKEFNQGIQLRLNINEAKKTFNEFKKTIIDGLGDEVLGTVQESFANISDLFKDNTLSKLTEHVNDIIKQVTENASVYSDKQSTMLEDLKTYYEQLMSLLEDINAYEDEIKRGYVDILTQVSDEMQTQLDAYEQLSSLIEHDMKIIKLLNGEDSYKELTTYYEKQVEVNNQRLDFQRQQVDLYKQQMDQLEAEGRKDTEAWETARDSWMSATSEYYSSIESSIENLQDKYLNAINAIFQTINEELTNGKGLSYIEQEWELINKNADEYLDSINASYGIQKLQNKYLEALDGNKSILQQERLNKLMDSEIAALREKDKLTQHDLDRADLKYQIALKQLALEEAQQNKTTLRLRRDSQGNYTYQYTQDNDEISKLRSELSDLYQQLYNLDKDAYSENVSKIYDVWTEYQQKMAEAAQINDPEQRAARELLIQEEYSKLLTNLAEQNENLKYELQQSSTSATIDLYDVNVDAYENMTDEQKNILNQFLNEGEITTETAFDVLREMYDTTSEDFSNMVGSMLPIWNSGYQEMIDTVAGEGGFGTVMSNIYSNISAETVNYENELKELETIAGISFDNIINGIDTTYDETKKLVGANDKLIESYNKEIEAIDAVWDALDALKKQYQETTDKAKEAAIAAHELLVAKNTKAADEYDKAAKDMVDGIQSSMTATTTTTDTPTTTSTNTSVSSAPSLTKGSYIDVKSGTRWYANSYGGGSSGTARGGYIKYINTKGSHPYNIGGLGWVRKSDIVGYATGGYTGDWAGADGKLAMLHQKELILNANDTKNILAAVAMLRNLTSATLDSLAANSGIGGNGLEQNVHIEASFPNVTSHTEIEEALNNLVNAASQRVNR